MTKVLPILSLLCLLGGLGACQEEAQLGEQCGGYSAHPIGCESDLFCCQPDPTIADIPGACIDPGDRGAFGVACGRSNGVCCGVGLYCEIGSSVTGDGSCLPYVR
jgi:hypothetical protein